jgi:hypothetical protein
MLPAGSLMKKNNTLNFPWVEKAGTKSFFIFLFLFQVLFIFQGLDFADEGFHSTFYQQIFKNPETVEYNFMFWMSGIIGGSWLRLFPEYGLLSLRLGGVILNMLTVLVTYRLLKNYIQDSYLKLGLLFIVLLNGAAVKDINYNNISALFFVLSIFFLSNSIINKKDFYLFIAGIFLSLAAFSRLSNISGLALMTVIIYSGFFVFTRSIPSQVKQILIFFAGSIFTVLALLGVMKLIGHYSIFMDSLKLLKSLAASTENTHGLANLIKIILKDYSTAILKRTLPFTVLVLICASLINYFKANPRLKSILQYFFPAVFMVFILGIVILKGTLAIWIFLILIFAALSFIACFLIVIGKGNNELRLISLAGTIMTFSLIAGSDYGITASGSTALWIGMPIATDYFLRICTLNFKSSFTILEHNLSKPQTREIALLVTDQQLQGIWKWGTYSCIALLVLHSVLYTYNDNPNRMKMTYSVHNAFLKGVFTTKVRADAVDEFLSESSKYIKQDDYLIVYEDVPMLYVLTQTRPFIKNSWLGIYDRNLLDAALNRALKENHILPVIVYQKVKTLPGPYWPDPNMDNSSFDIENPKNRPIKNFIEKNNYHLVWENIAFKIYIANSLKTNF